MLELICSIPEHIGWIIVGVLGTLAAEGIGCLAHIGWLSWKACHTEEEETEEE